MCVTAFLSLVMPLEETRQMGKINYKTAPLHRTILIYIPYKFM